MHYKRPAISVCMTTYNAENFLKTQIDSILEQLESEDEIIIVDDFSSDSTELIVKDYNDVRIRFFKNEQNLREIKSFERAILLAQNEYIFLSDHDDIWVPHRVEKMLEAMKNGKNIVFGNINNFSNIEINKARNPPKLLKKNENKILKNIILTFLGKGSYYGCALAFKKEIVNKILPFPNHVESHDIYIALYAIIKRRLVYCEEVVLDRRISQQNHSLKKRSIFQKIRSRYFLILNIIKIFSLES